MSFHIQLLSLLMQVFSKTQKKSAAANNQQRVVWGFFKNLLSVFCNMQTHTHTRVGELLSHHSDISQRFFPELFQITEIPENPQKGPCFPIFSQISCSPAAGTMIPLVLDSCSFSSFVLITALIRSMRHAQQNQQFMQQQELFFVFLDKHFNKLNLTTLQADKRN